MAKRSLAPLRETSVSSTTRAVQTTGVEVTQLGVGRGSRGNCEIEGSADAIALDAEKAADSGSMRSGGLMRRAGQHKPLRQYHERRSGCEVAACSIFVADGTKVGRKGEK